MKPLQFMVTVLVNAVPGVVTTAASGNPFPIPFAMVTEDRIYMCNVMY